MLLFSDLSQPAIKAETQRTVWFIYAGTPRKTFTAAIGMKSSDAKPFLYILCIRDLKADFTVSV